MRRTIAAASFLPLVLALSGLVGPGCGGGGSEQPDSAVLDASPLPDGPDGTAADSQPEDGGADAEPVSPLLPEDLPDPLPAGTPKVTLITFNTGLAPTLRGSTQRLPLIIDAVKTSGADLLCLQEVWTVYTSPKAFAEAVATVYPYSFWQERGVTPMGSGILILSKHPLYRGRAHSFTVQEPGNYFDKAVIAADVVTPDAYFHVMCTHTAAPTDETGPPLRKAQIDEANALAAENGYQAGVTFFLGDFNTGPDPVQDCTPTTDPPCRAPDVESYAYLLQTWTDPNETWQQCTWCRDVAMPFQISAAFNEDPSQRIDFCLYRGLDAQQFQSRSLVFHETVNVQVGSVTLEHLSDHLGVKCVFGS